MTDPNGVLGTSHLMNSSQVGAPVARLNWRRNSYFLGFLNFRMN
jgi:hypothetical protein